MRIATAVFAGVALWCSAASGAPGRLLGRANLLRSFPGLAIRTMRVDAQGNLFLAGVTTSAGLPTTPGALSTHYVGSSCQDVGPPHPCADLYVAVLDAAGNVEFGSYIGGAGEESFAAIDAAGAGAIMLTGTTNSSDFPSTAPPLTSAAPLRPRSFLMRLAWRDSQSALRSSVILGDALVFQPRAVAVDTLGRVYVGGAASNGFPATAEAFQTAPGNESSNGFLLRLASDAVTVDYATYLSGSSADEIEQIAVAANGDVYVGGAASSADFPAIAGSYINIAQQPGSLITNAFVARFRPDSGRFTYIARLGGSASNSVSALAVDSDGVAYLAGQTSSDDFPVTAGAAQTERLGVMNPYVAKLSGDGTTLLFSTFLGGEGYDTLSSLFLEPEGTVVVVGTAGSRLFRLTSDAHEPCNGAPFPTQNSGFLARLKPDGSEVSYASYFTAGTFDTAVRAAALDAEGRLTVVVGADPLDLTRYGGPLQTFVQPSEDHVVRLEPGEAPRTACLVNAASGSAQAVTAGELVAIYGQGLGPSQALFLSPGADGYPTEAGGARVLFDGVAAPLLYVGPTQINAVAPASVAGRSTVTAVVEVDGEVRASIPAAVLPIVPGLFPSYSSRLAAAQNEDGTPNRRDNPAQPGSLVRLFATGDAALMTGRRDGEVVPEPGPPLPHDVKVQVGAQFAEVVYAGQAPGGVAGLMEITIRLPLSFVLPAAEQNLVLYVGDTFTLGRVTLAVSPLGN